MIPSNTLTKILFSAAAFLASTLAVAQAEPAMNLDQLLNKVQKDAEQEAKINSEREAAFLKDKQRQAQLLADAKAELQRLEKRSDELKAEFDSQEKQLADAEEKLRITMGTLGELFGVVRQVAGDTNGLFENSIISSQYPGRQALMAKLAETKSLPSIQQLKKLWFELQREMTESGKVVTYEGKYVRLDGKAENAPITRVGSFNVLTEDKFLYFQPDTQALVELGRQPAGRFLAQAEELSSSTGENGFTKFAVDPSRGVLLSMLVQAPSLFERFQQGGVVGYVIACLLIIGLLIVLERWFSLSRIGGKISEQMTKTTPVEGNPLGNVMLAAKDEGDIDPETYELKIDEAILKETPKIERGIQTVKILAGVAPLLGLLGTVTGMIATFQSITLFGTGDPKLMAGGISQALVTTVLGLVAAIPLMLAHSFVSAKSKGIIQVLEEQGTGLLAKFIESKQ